MNADCWRRRNVLHVRGEFISTPRQLVKITQALVFARATQEKSLFMRTCSSESASDERLGQVVVFVRDGRGVSAKRHAQKPFTSL